MALVDDVVALVSEGLAARANPTKAGPMAAYMKTAQPFYGVMKPDRVPLFREMVRRFRPHDRAEWEAVVLALWALPHREEQYAALWFARSQRRFLDQDALPLAEHLVRTGAWWDLVDEVAGRIVAPAQLKHRAAVRPVLDRWIDDGSSFWVRRAAILSQLGHKAATDAAQLFDYCLRRAYEREFFVRKAIGWALRDYSYAAPGLVQSFLAANRSRLSGLSLREGAKQLIREGLWESPPKRPRRKADGGASGG